MSGMYFHRFLHAFSRRLPSVALLLLSFCVSSAPPADACVGPPPEPVCTKTLALAIAGPPTVLLPGGGSFEVSALVFFETLDFPAGFGACPMGPYVVDVEVTALCESGAPGRGTTLGELIGRGFNEIAVTVDVPAGPPRACTLVALATLRLADGMVLTDSAQSLACLAEAAPGQPLVPRLEIERLGPSASGLLRAHPGDHTVQAFRLTNHDPSAAFEGLLRGVSHNESRQPGFSGPMPPGTAVVSVSDPAVGDHFPIDFDPGLPTGALGSCLPLPTDPLAPEPRQIERTLRLEPGESTVVAIRSRSWGMCADGSCSRVDVELEGLFDGGAPGLACTGFVNAADLDAPEDRACDDGGEKVRPVGPPGPEMPFITLTGEPRQGAPVAIDALVTLAATLGGEPLPVTSTFAEKLGDEDGRVQFQLLFEDNEGFDALDVDFDVELFSTPGTPALGITTDHPPATGAPNGFESRSPWADLLARLHELERTVGDSSLELTVRVSGVGILSSGARRPIFFGQSLFGLRPGGGGLSGGLSGSLGDGELEVPPGDGLEALEVSFDLRGFLSPEPQGFVIFEDGFESGNVSRWSISTPP